jgi:hypothetical protein
MPLLEMPAFIFCFVSLLCLINTFPSEKQNILSVLFPWLLILTQRMGVGWRKEGQSLYLTTKIIPSSWYVWQLHRVDIWGDWVARAVLIYLAIGTEGIGSNK